MDRSNSSDSGMEDSGAGAETKKAKVDSGNSSGVDELAEDKDSDMMQEENGGVNNDNENQITSSTSAVKEEEVNGKTTPPVVSSSSTTAVAKVVEEVSSSSVVPSSSTTVVSSGSEEITEKVEGTSLMSPQKKEEDFGEPVELKVIFNKNPLSIKMPLKKTVGDLKVLIEKETNVAKEMQKVCIKGIAKDEATLESLGVTSSTKILVIGTSIRDLMEVTKRPDKSTLAAEDLSRNEAQNNWCSLPQHKRIVDKGVPDDAMPGILNEPELLPDIPLFGMVNSKGKKVRLTFKLELDELWIGTKERTDKIPIGTIQHVDTQVITGYEHYHIIAIQLGPTEASRYFIYWVPAQYTQAIKDALSN